MKSESTGAGAPISKKDLKELLHETKETLAVDLKNDNSNGTFGYLDLWNVQKRQRTAASMRRRLM